MMAEIMRQTQNPRHVATAHLGRRFAYLSIECSCFFDDQDTRFGTLALHYERSCRAGKRAPDDHDVVIEIHRSSQIGRSTIETQSVCIRLFICHQSKRRDDRMRTPKASRNETAVMKHFARSALECDASSHRFPKFKMLHVEPIIEHSVFYREHWQQ